MPCFKQLLTVFCAMLINYLLIMEIGEIYCLVEYTKMKYLINTEMKYCIPVIKKVPNHILFSICFLILITTVLLKFIVVTVFKSGMTKLITFTAQVLLFALREFNTYSIPHSSYFSSFVAVWISLATYKEIVLCLLLIHCIKLCIINAFIKQQIFTV